MVFVADIDLLQNDAIRLSNISFGDLGFEWDSSGVNVNGWNPGLKLSIEMSVSFSSRQIIELPGIEKADLIELVVRFYAKNSMTRKTLTQTLNDSALESGYATFDILFEEGEVYGPIDFLIGIVLTKNNVGTKHILVENSHRISLGGSKGGLNIVWAELENDSMWKFSFTSSEDTQTIKHLSHHSAIEVALNSRNVEIFDTNSLIRGLLLADLLFHVVDWVMHLPKDTYLDLIEIFGTPELEKSGIVGSWMLLIISSFSQAGLSFDEESFANWAIDKFKIKNTLQDKSLRLAR